MLAAHIVLPEKDVWYLLPIGELGRAKSLRFYPELVGRRPRWERWREAWDVLRDCTPRK